MMNMMTNDALAYGVINGMASKELLAFTKATKAKAYNYLLWALPSNKSQS